MFHKMRRKDRELSEEDIVSILNECNEGVLSTYGEDGYPYGVPVNYAYDNHKIYFHCAKDVGHKVENINFHPKVCFTVIQEAEVLTKEFSTKYKSVIAFGEAKELYHQEKQRALELLSNKYADVTKEVSDKYIQQFIEKTAIYEIMIEHASAKGRK